MTGGLLVDKKNGIVPHWVFMPSKIVFPVRPQNFPIPYMICEYYVLGRAIQLLEKKKDFIAATIAISFTLRIRTFTT